MITLTEHLLEALDPDEIIDATGKVVSRPKKKRMMKKAAIAGAGLAAAGAAAYGIHKLRQRNKAKKAAQQE